MNTENLEYVGFWPRVGASLIDTLVQFAVTLPLTYAIYGRLSSPVASSYFMGPSDIAINLLLPFAATVALWCFVGATPGKMAMSARIVDADTGEPLTIGASTIRYIGYIVSAIPLLVGFFWIALDRRKQGWHDKMANSVVIRPSGLESVRFSARGDSHPGTSEAREPTF